MPNYVHETNAALITKMQQAQTNIDTLTAHIRKLNFNQSAVDVHIPSVLETPVLSLNAQALVDFLKDQRDVHKQALRDINAELHKRFENEYATEEPSLADDTVGVPAPPIAPSTEPSTRATGKKGKSLSAPTIQREPGDDLL